MKQWAVRQGRPIKEPVADYILQGLHVSPGAPQQHGARVVELDASGIPLFRPDPGSIGAPIDLATTLQLEQAALKQEARHPPGCLLDVNVWLAGAFAAQA